MNPTVKQKWLTALRSGEYEQAQHELHTHDHHFCCLGVLCDLYATEHNVPWQLREDFSGYLILANKDILPAEVADWAELRDINPSVPDEVHQDGDQLYLIELSAYNDDHDYDFNQIADLIERHL